jgi:Rad3-related DNA helicase
VKPEKIKLSVTTLAEFSCRQGDLELNGTIGPTAREGMRAHQRIQESRSCENEVRVAVDLSVEKTPVRLTGRIDLVDTHVHKLSEIKTTLVPADKLSTAKKALQWAQIKLYGYCYYQQIKADAVQPLPSTLQLELIHSNIRANTEYSDVQAFSVDELEQFALDALYTYVRWIQKVRLSQHRTQRSASDLQFPHKHYRAGQRDMAAAVFRAVRDGETLMVEAPTGTGKTVSSLFPAVKALGEGYVKHAVYLTAKTSGRNSAMQAIASLQQGGLDITAVQIRSKQPTCFCSNGRCERDDTGTCPMTIGFFDRLPAARDEILDAGVVSGEQFDAIAWAHQVCPFELALQMLPWVSLVVCDFNYVFDPLVRIARFSESRRDTALLVDESHNLLDRSRGMHSGELNRIQFLDAIKELNGAHAFLASRLNSLSNALMRHSRGLDSEVSVSTESPKSIAHAAAEFVAVYMEALDTGPVLPETFVDLFKSACRYVAIHELYGQHHRVVSRIDSAGNRRSVTVTLKCLDAASFLLPQYKLFRSTVVFSATLRPAVFYRDALGLSEQAQYLELASPFDHSRALYCVVNYVNTRYRYRERSSAELTSTLFTMVSASPGNYMVFFPSYAYLDLAHQHFVNAHPAIQTWIQSRHADVQEREQLLAGLAQSGTRLGFAILGGVFGEGVDYVGDLLVGAAVVGVGLPSFGAEQDLIADNYREQGLDGYDYAYRYPGLTKVLQTAGRVIRSETDKGVILLIDDRFNQPAYRSLFPKHWPVDTATSELDLADFLRKFWRN